MSTDKTPATELHKEALSTERALKLALEFIDANTYGGDDVVQLMTAIRVALASKSEALAQSRSDEEQPAQQAGHTFYDGTGNVVAHLDATAEITMDYSKPSAWAQRKPWVHATTWRGLTDKEIEQCMKQAYATVQGRNLEHAFAHAIEAKLREKNEHREKNA